MESCKAEMCGGVMCVHVQFVVSGAHMYDTCIIICIVLH